MEARDDQRKHNRYGIQARAGVPVRLDTRERLERGRTTRREGKKTEKWNNPSHKSSTSGAELALTPALTEKRLAFPF